jgi:hypothetical protein
MSCVTEPMRCSYRFLILKCDVFKERAKQAEESVARPATTHYDFIIWPALISIENFNFLVLKTFAQSNSSTIISGRQRFLGTCVRENPN